MPGDPGDPGGAVQSREDVDGGTGADGSRHMALRRNEIPEGRLVSMVTMMINEAVKKRPKVKRRVSGMRLSAVCVELWGYG